MRNYSEARRLRVACAYLACVWAAAESVPLREEVKVQCRAYVQGFLNANTDLCYGKRLDTPKGLAILESPENIAQGRVGDVHRPWGYGAGMEDVALQNGYLLFALCDAYETTHDPFFADFAHRVFRGMKRIASCASVPGFVPRGPHPDGKSYYRDSSTDQHTLFVCALWRFARSTIATSEERAFVRQALLDVGARLERNKWILKVEDDSRLAHVGWNWSAINQGSSGLFLSTIGAVADTTGDAHWCGLYRRFADEADGKRWECISRDPPASPRYTLFYNQHAFRLATLARLEGDRARQDQVRQRLRATARHMLTCNALAEWRTLDWIGKIPEAHVQEYLGTLGVKPGERQTVAQLWARYEPGKRSPPMSWDQRRRSYAALCLRAPLVSWQYALLSGDPELCRQALAMAEQVAERIDIRRERSGWIANETIVFLLLALAVSG
ncbi:MAG: hypothetical protein KAI66_12705 [Lentisphaeria bacterium]|nr:hypothetical protein [Lentisphaeria bacterium]